MIKHRVVIRHSIGEVVVDIFEGNCFTPKQNFTREFEAHLAHYMRCGFRIEIDEVRDDG
jgi:hypothetical protein